MNTKSRMPIREFSILTGISRDSLRFYDKIGLLSPDVRGDNGYRYYTDRQLDMAFLIGDLRALGIGLEEIKRYADERSPEHMLAFFGRQDARIEEEIKRLRTIQELMRLRSEMAVQALQHTGNEVVLEQREKEPIFLCPPMEPECSDQDRVIRSYLYAEEHGVNVGFPLGAVIPGDRLTDGTSLASRYYFKTLDQQNGWKREGTYAVYYHDMKDGPTEDFYRPLLVFIQERGLRTEGDAYHEYLMDELCIHDSEQYRLRVEIQVTR